MPSAFVYGISVIVAIAYGTFVVRSAHEYSHFVGDDVVAFWQARQWGLLRHLENTIDVHMVPLHRLVSFAVAWIAPMNFAFGLTVLVVLHVAGLLLFYSALKALAPSPACPVLVAWYASYVYLDSLFEFWTAGLHRLPYICAMAAAFLAYCSFRSNPGWWGATRVLAPFIVGLGFFEKMMLFPVVLAAIEFSLGPVNNPRARRMTWMLIGILSLLACVYYVIWRRAVGDNWSSLNRNFFILFDYLWISWAMLVRTCAGQTFEQTTLVGLILLGVICIPCVFLRPRNALVLLMGFVTISIHLVAPAVSESRALLKEALAVFSYRYYPDVFFLLIVFVALLIRGAISTPRVQSWIAAKKTSVKWAFAIAVSALLCVHAVEAATNWDNVDSVFNADCRRIKEYRDNVEAGLKRLRNRKIPLRFVDGIVPNYVDPFVGRHASHSYMLEAMGYSASFQKPGASVYQITSNGTIVPSRKRR
jgi:hypothetical protein